jgi:autotransporter-associated beta strand protein/T5SS/PEP-CTERM-associated repeat protein
MASQLNSKLRSGKAAYLPEELRPMQTRLCGGCSVAALAIALVGMSTAASAQTWNGTTSTDWTVGTNWNGGVAPTPAGNVIIGTTLPNPTVLGVGGAASGAASALRVGNSGIAGALTIQNGSTLTTTGGVTVGAFGGTGIVTVTGIGSRLTAGAVLTVGNATTGTLNIENGGTVTANGGLNLPAFSGNGTLNISSGGTLETTFLAGGTVVTRQANFDNGTLRALGNNAAWVANTFTAGQLNIAAGGLTLDSNGFTVTAQSGFSGVGGLTKAGAGTVILSRAQTYTGATTISEGTLGLSSTGSLAASSRVVANGTFDVSSVAGAGTSIQSLAGSGAVALGAKMLTLTNANDAFSGTISGTGGLTLTGGVQTLTGANTYSGGTFLNGGVLSITGDEALGATSGALSFNGGTLQTTASFASGRNATVNAGGATIETVADWAWSGILGGAGALTKSGNATLQLTGDSSGFTGSTTVAGGSLVVNGSLAGSALTVQSGARLGGSGTVGATMLAGGARITPGNSVGTLTINGAYVQGAGSVYEAELDPTTVTSDLIRVNGLATLATGASLSIVNYTGGAFVAGQRYTILTSTG